MNIQSLNLIPLAKHRNFIRSQPDKTKSHRATHLREARWKLFLPLFLDSTNGQPAAAARHCLLPRHRSDRPLFIIGIQKQKPHEVAYYADKLSISPRYLANLCKAVSNKSAKEWINEYMMNDVRRYLIGTDLSIKEVASRTLFTNFSFFSKTVKHYFGKAPLELRNQKQ